MAHPAVPQQTTRTAMKTMKAKRVSKVAKGRLAKALVLRGSKEKTTGGLRRDALMKNKRGKVVSKRASAAGKRAYKQIAGWVEGVMAARRALKMKGFVGEYYGYEDMRIGVAQFGNGEILDDGTVSDALLIQPLDNDMGKVKKAIEGLEYKKGFTNMAQAFTMAEKMFLLGGRRRAMSAVMTLTDGKPSFLFNTYEKVMQLKDKHVKLFFAPVTEFAGEELALMKKWASSPWETNLVHVPGLAPLKADSALFAQQMVVKFCPEAMSPSSMMVEEQEMGYMLVAENAHCGTRGRLLTDQKGTQAADCAALAQGAGVTAFSLGVHHARGRCYAEGLAVTDALVAEWEKDRINPKCEGGDWEKDELFDFYALVPLAAP